jgi:hypothetical protein
LWIAIRCGHTVVLRHLGVVELPVEHGAMPTG